MRGEELLAELEFCSARSCPVFCQDLNGSLAPNLDVLGRARVIPCSEPPDLGKGFQCIARKDRMPNMPAKIKYSSDVNRTAWFANRKGFEALFLPIDWKSPFWSLIMEIGHDLELMDDYFNNERRGILDHGI